MCIVQTHETSSKTYHRSHMCAIPYRNLCKLIRIGKIDCWLPFVVDFVSAYSLAPVLASQLGQI